MGNIEVFEFERVSLTASRYSGEVDKTGGVIIFKTAEGYHPGLIINANSPIVQQRISGAMNFLDMFFFKPSPPAPVMFALKGAAFPLDLINGLSRSWMSAEELSDTARANLNRQDGRQKVLREYKKATKKCRNIAHISSSGGAPALHRAGGNHQPS